MFQRVPVNYDMTVCPAQRVRGQSSLWPYMYFVPPVFKFVQTKKDEPSGYVRIVFKIKRLGNMGGPLLPGMGVANVNRQRHRCFERRNLR